MRHVELGRSGGGEGLAGHGLEHEIAVVAGELLKPHVENFLAGLCHQAVVQSRGDEAPLAAFVADRLSVHGHVKVRIADAIIPLMHGRMPLSTVPSPTARTTPTIT